MRRSPGTAWPPCRCPLWRWAPIDFALPFLRQAEHFRQSFPECRCRNADAKLALERLGYQMSRRIWPAMIRLAKIAEVAVFDGKPRFLLSFPFFVSLFRPYRIDVNSHVGDGLVDNARPRRQCFVGDNWKKNGRVPCGGHSPCGLTAAGCLYNEKSRRNVLIRCVPVPGLRGDSFERLVGAVCVS